MTGGENTNRLLGCASCLKVTETSATQRTRRPVSPPHKPTQPLLSDPHSATSSRGMVDLDDLHQSEPPSSPVPKPVKRKPCEATSEHVKTPRHASPSPPAPVSKDLTESHAKTVVHILGQTLAQVTGGIRTMVEQKQGLGATGHHDNGTNNAECDSMSLDLRCLMTGFMTVYLCFIKVLLQDLLPATECPFETYMGLFSSEDDVLADADDLFCWHFQQVHRHTPIVHHLRDQFATQGIPPFRSLQLVDTIFSNFYTTHLLQVAAQKHQKDHGQFYTPQSVVRFMWSGCLHFDDSADLPRVLDPCMGIGAFLCEYLTRLIDHHSRGSVWNQGETLQTLMQTLPPNLWGVEIDPFAYNLGKLNVIVHLFPLYRRLLELGITPPPRSMDRLCLLCNDTLKLREETNLLLVAADGRRAMSPWESEQLRRLRNPKELQFDYIVTNPPYMIRKTGFITIPDPALYDDRILGGRGTQAYLYFMWICLQRCDAERGQLCLITPSQWTVLEFAEQLRAWIWQHCRLLEIYQFEPFKVWPKVQTDSLIFRLRMRSSSLGSRDTIFMRHLSRNRTSLQDILDEYQAFDPRKDRHDQIKCKITHTDPIDRILLSPHASFAFLSPTSSVSDQLMELTHDLPRLCDGELRNDVTSLAPLIWHRGPNTNPVYALVVCTRWATDTFGQKCCDRWLRPVFYWNGKSSSSNDSTGKESLFWRNRDKERLTKKENSPAEAYVPFYAHADDDHYSMILVDRQDAQRIEKEQHPDDLALYRYLCEARHTLQPTKTDRSMAWCQYNKCGVDVAVKIVHAINFGYFTRTQPRQRFFIDTARRCVTNQCMYFTVKPSTSTEEPLSAYFFCGLLNSSVIQFFIGAHCYYDQQGRMRFFGKHMAKIPYATPSAKAARWMHTWVLDLIHVRSLIGEMARFAKLRSVVEQVRNCAWDLSDHDRQACLALPFRAWFDARSSKQQGPASQWIDTTLMSQSQGTMLEPLLRLLKVASLLQYGVDHLAFEIYAIPPELQQGLEHELGLIPTSAWREHLDKKEDWHAHLPVLATWILQE